MMVAPDWEVIWLRKSHTLIVRFAYKNREEKSQSFNSCSTNQDEERLPGYQPSLMSLSFVLPASWGCENKLDIAVPKLIRIFTYS